MIYCHLLALQKVKQCPDVSAVKLAKDISNVKGLAVRANTIRKTLNSTGYYGRISRKIRQSVRPNHQNRLLFRKRYKDRPVEF